MAELWDLIRDAVLDDRYLVSWHADERCEEREIATWQVVAGAVDASLVEERPWDEPNPSVVTRELLPNGDEVEVVWSWLQGSKRAQLVTVCFPGCFP